MQSSDIPSKIQLPFAKNAGGPYIRTVPIPSQIGIQDGAASWNDGFPPLNFLPDSAGGVNPFGQDMNGVLNAISSLLWWYSAGGPVSYDSSFQTAIGGYPKGAIVQSVTTLGMLWQSTAENNMTDPDTGGAGWANLLDTTFKQNIPDWSSGTYTLVGSDANLSILHPVADAANRILMIPANSSVPFAIGTVVILINEAVSNTLSLQITSDTLMLAGLGYTGTRTLAGNGIATLFKVTATKWYVFGTGIY
jgi:hypothetical protein